MIKEIIVAGIKLNSYTALENLTKIGKRMDNNVFTTVEEVYMGTLLLAKEDEVVKDLVETLDITVVAENDIWDAAGENSNLRRREVENREFFNHLMHILERYKYSVLFLGETSQEADATCEYVKGEFPRLHVAGAIALEACLGDEEGIINEINLLTPDVVGSVLPSPKQEYFLAENRNKLLTRLWYGVGSGKITGQKHSFKYMILKAFRKYKLMDYVKSERNTDR